MFNNCVFWAYFKMVEVLISYINKVMKLGIAASRRKIATISNAHIVILYL